MLQIEKHWFFFCTLLGNACTLDPGRGFSTVDGAQLEARLEPAAQRDLGNHTLLTNLLYQVSLEEALLTVDRVELAETDEAGESVPVLTLPDGEASNLLDPSAIALNRFEPSHELPLVRLTTLAATLTHIRIRALVSAGPAASALAQPVELVVDLPLDQALTSAIDLAINRDAPSHIVLYTDLVIDTPLFDNVEFTAEAASGGLDVRTSAQPIAAALQAALAESELELHVE